MGMEPRPLQQEFAQSIEESLQSSREVATFVEGPTGIGKNLWLPPSLTSAYKGPDCCQCSNQGLTRPNHATGS